MNSFPSQFRSMVSGPLTKHGYLPVMPYAIVKRCIFLTLQVLIGLLFVGLGFGYPQTAYAQTTRYTNTTDSATNGINENATPCSNRFTRTFSVGTNYTISDVNIGVMMAHTYRGDLLMYLVAPDGTRIQLNNGNGNGAQNFNVLYDDSAGSSITTHSAGDTASAGTTVPPYQRTFSPTSSLSGFNGKSSQGTWTLEICDQFGGDSGTFYQADLYLTALSTNTADLSLTKTVVPSAPLSGAKVAYTLTVTNAASSTGTATGIQVRDILPGGLTYRDQSGTGSYNSGTGIWSVGSLAPGSSASITINSADFTNPGTVVTNTAEIIASSLADPDSTPNNGSTGEDDYASATYTTANYPAAGTPPTLTCAAGSNLFDWDVQPWTTGALSRSFTIGGVATSLQFTGNTNRLIADPSTTSQTPVRNQSSTGGFAGQNSLMLAVDLANTSESVTGTWTFTGGIGGLQFRLSDIDLYYGQFSDRVTVTGSYQGVAVTPTLTRGSTNVVVGNTANATAVADNTTALGNVVVTFSQTVDTVVVNYGADPGSSPADPGIQAIALLDMTMCNPNPLSDWSDAPTSGTSYGTASHSLNTGIRMGASVDGESAALPSANADGDDLNGTDDENGVTLPSMQAGTIANIPVSVTGSGGYLQAWFDWNGDGDFADAGEQVATNLQDGGARDFDGASNGQILVKVVVPGTTTSSQTFARFRWSTTASLGSTGSAANGEVEDYPISILTDGATPILRGCGGLDVSTHSFTTNPSAGTVVTGSANGTFAIGSTTNGFGAITGVAGSKGIEQLHAAAGAGNPDSFTKAYTVTPSTGSLVKQAVICQSPYENSGGNDEPNEMTLTWAGGTSAVIYDPSNQITSHANGAVINSGTTLIFANAIPNGVGTNGGGLAGPDNWAVIVNAGNTSSAFTVNLTSAGCNLASNTNFCHLMNTTSNTSGERFMEWIAFDTELVSNVTPISVTKVSSIISDPVNGATNPKAIPGALVEYTFAVSNPNGFAINSVVMTDQQPGDLTMCVASLGATGPVLFIDGSPASGLTYSYVSLASTTDHLEFSNNNGTSWTYIPTADANGCDAAITGFRIKPTGSLGATRNFTARARFLIE